jgi:hypothetical protein
MRDDKEDRLAIGCFIASAAAFLLAFFVIVELLVRYLHQL